MFDLLIRSGRLVTAAGETPGELGIQGGRIAAILPPGAEADAREVVDATGLKLLPGLVDAHVHLREPGLTQKEDFLSGSHAAALGGVTTLLDMPTDDPWTETPEQLAAKMALAAGRLHVDVGFQAVLSRTGCDLAGLLDLGPVSLELFTADVPEAYLFESIAEVAQMLGRITGSAAGREMAVGVSPGDQSILRAAPAGRDIAAFLASRPPLAEASGVARAVLAAAQSGAKVHVRQTNSRLGIETFRGLRSLADVTLETTPQNFFFTAADYETTGAGLKGSPPFRGAEDVAALRQALSDGLIDVIATDHAPHLPAEKAAPAPSFAEIPGGMAGLQTLLPVMLRLVAERVLTLSDLVRVCCENPARRFGLGHRKGVIAPGYDADLILLDPAQETAISHGAQVSRAGWTPFDGWRVPGRIAAVYLRGGRIVDQGRLVLSQHGQVVRRAS
ncbi:dihydroorotase [Paracoccus aminophilus]|uniref:Dihydroorotase n=1 Tax=Paracoccus aminophilus JCM 7686 TaxID=1367847 RepID=S5YGM5_PARAH|nr:dihydroorotase family protein [Paracoccus aminophilus]AGT10608.1 dihydroorotase [Paracoccus aminophilus JCM 7686]